jgi:polyribonucleotide nucleotidyltransferase
MREKIIEVELNGIKEKYCFGKVARQSNGSVLYSQGKIVILATVVMDEKPVREPFLPLTVQYIEKAYAAAKIPGGFIKRESRPGDFETITSRIIDRSLRPLFPEGFPYPTVITVMVLSSDENADLQVAALHAANAALLVSDLPISSSVSALRVGRLDGRTYMNPSLEELERSTLDMLMVGSGDELLMIEMGARASEKIEEIDEIEPLDAEAMMGPIPIVLSRQDSNELDENEMMTIIAEGLTSIREASRIYEDMFLPVKKNSETREYVPSEVSIEELEDILKERFSGKIQKALGGMGKQERARLMKELVCDAFVLMKELGRDFEEGEVLQAMELLEKKLLRKQILEKGIRADGRGVDEVRPVSIETNLLPSVHGSALFTRGETQVLVTVTLGESKEGQMYELLTDRHPHTERFMLHYNFPGFSVGEARPIGAPGRRELGHGILAKRAIEPVIDRNIKHTIRLVSEVLESNGSSSMATVCGGTLALCAAEIEISDLVAGVAMGLVRDGDRYMVLTDIMGLEDHDGDMDLKIAGTRKGITAMQMDVKKKGIDPKILGDALQQARKARLEILDIMEEAREKIRPSGALPVSEHFHIDPSKIVHIIGKAGATIRDIIERFEVKIDLDREKGGVKVTGSDEAKVRAAREHISNIASSRNEMKSVPHYEKGKKYRGKIKKIMDYGLFVEMPGGYDALLHISKMGKERAINLNDMYHEGDEIEVVVLEQKGRKVELALPEYTV